ncbi:LytR/AlgR family response regulator transcription factor [Paraphotobacterium marinum]|nr:LytTR family DNA-binding domain-containing protein [Paraphotobacterium marinum]
MFDIIKKIHKRNPIIKFFIILIICSSFASYFEMLMRGSHWHFLNELDPFNELIAALISMISQIAALYFIDITFIQQNKSFFKWKTCLQFIICLFICYVFHFILLLMKDIFLKRNLYDEDFFYEITVNTGIIIDVIAYIYITRFWMEPYNILTSQVHSLSLNQKNKTQKYLQTTDLDEKNIFETNKQKKSNINYFEVVKSNQTYYVKHHEILFIKAASNYMEINSFNGLFPVRSTLKNIKEVLSDHFIQIHRSVIINLDSVKAFKYDEVHKKYVVTVIDNTQFNISKSFIENFRKAWKSKQLNKSDKI